jgi:anti-sigma factor (TIGR02949 family)
MVCEEYIANYLSADADGELSSVERAAARAHLAGCPNCRARLAQERALKALVKERLRKAPAPPEMRAAIRLSLDRIDASATRRESGRIVAEFRRPQMWAPLLALAASVVFAVTMRDRIARQAPIPLFDVAIENFARFEGRFEPNVPSDSASAIAEHYHTAKMPPYIWNFSPFGFELVGGRLDRLANGRPATFTFYRGPKGALMCTRFQPDDLSFPPGGRELQTDQYIYYYRGFSLVLSINTERRWLCILMSRLPPEELADDLSSLEG